MGKREEKEEGEEGMVVELDLDVRTLKGNSALHLAWCVALPYVALPLLY